MGEREPALTLALLDPALDRELVRAVLDGARDYYHLWLGRDAGQEELDDFFTSAPPDCEPAASQRLGLFVAGQIVGLAELAFDYPAAGDAYLGLMLVIAPARGQGIGARALALIEARARAKAARALYLAVLMANPRGMQFWERQGFRHTGVVRDWTDGPVPHRAARLVKPLSVVDLAQGA